uniref:Uncharacterized protein n=1 Tax=Globodera rostochiensis TaxID=31243 RepID=A0A914IFU9_GLORO
MLNKNFSIFFVLLLVLTENNLIFAKSTRTPRTTTATASDDELDEIVNDISETPKNGDDNLSTSNEIFELGANSPTTNNGKNQYSTLSHDSDEQQQQLALPKMRTEANFTILPPPILTTEQIDAIARQSAAMITRSALKHSKEIFAKFAPDSWTEALADAFLHEHLSLTSNNENEDDETEADVISDGSDRETTTTTASNFDGGTPFGAEEASEIRSHDQLMNLLKIKCPRGFAQIVALNEAINETIRQLPPHVRQTLEEYGKRFKNQSLYLGGAESVASVKSLLVELLEELKSVTREEREQLGDLFPKLRNVVTDSKIDQLLDLSVECFNGSRAACLNASQLAVQIWTSATAANYVENPIAAKKLQRKERT